MKKVCDKCGREFTTYSSIGKYCSRICANGRAPSKKTTRKCRQCGKVFDAYDAKTRPTSGRFCSNTCARRGSSRFKGRSLDALFSHFIRVRDAKCLRCSKVETLQCSHVMPRTWLATRWDPDNAITLCYACHLHWWHKDPLGAAEWFEAMWPGRYQRVRSRALAAMKPDVEAVHKDLSARLDALKVAA